MGAFNNSVDQMLPNFDHPSSGKLWWFYITSTLCLQNQGWTDSLPPLTILVHVVIEWPPMDLAYFAFAVHLVHCLRMVFLNLDEKGERCRDCIETLPWLEALLLRFGGHRRKCPMTNIVSDKVRLSSTSRGTRQLMVYTPP